MEYLTKLAQYRLANKIAIEIKHFLKGTEPNHVCTLYSASVVGLHQFVPDELLGMFDENELEVRVECSFCH